MVFFLLTAKINRSQQKTPRLTHCYAGCRKGWWWWGHCSPLALWLYPFPCLWLPKLQVDVILHDCTDLCPSHSHDGCKSFAQRSRTVDVIIVMENFVMTSHLTSSMCKCNDLKTLKRENYKTTFPDYLPQISPTAGLKLKIILSMPRNCLSSLSRDFNSWNMHSIFPHEDANEPLLFKAGDPILALIYRMTL